MRESCYLGKRKGKKDAKSCSVVYGLEFEYVIFDGIFFDDVASPSSR